MALWEVIRIVEERFEVEAETKEQAREQAENPHTVKVLKETIRRK